MFFKFKRIVRRGSEELLHFDREMLEHLGIEPKSLDPKVEVELLYNPPRIRLANATNQVEAR